MIRIKIETASGLYIQNNVMDWIPSIYKAVDTNRAHLAEFLSAIVENTTTEQDSFDFFNSCKYQSIYAEHSPNVISKDDQFIGLVGTARGEEKLKALEIGYWIQKQYEGNGYITQSVKTLTDYLFTHFDVETIYIRCSAKNIRSAGIPERLGWQKIEDFTKTEQFKHIATCQAAWKITRGDWGSEK